jgi:hypothetical protein
MLGSKEVYVAGLVKRSQLDLINIELKVQVHEWLVVTGKIGDSLSSVSERGLVLEGK